MLVTCRVLVLLIVLGASLGVQMESDEEVVLLFSDFASLDESEEGWNVRVRAWIYKPEDRSLARRALLGLLARRLGLNNEEEGSQIFRERARMFLVDNERNKTISVRIAGFTSELGPSEANGHVVARVRVPRKDLAATSGMWHESTSGQRSPHGGSPPSVLVEVIEPKTSKVVASESVLLIGKRGISIISDLDDTIKVSNVASKRALLANSFLKDFEAVPGMARVYSEWATRGAAFHYVSASPWQLYPPLRAFLRDNGFPGGSLSLKTFRWKDSSFFDLFAQNDRVKRPYIEEILTAFPERKFILVGDSGERDPALYASLASAYPEQIARIFIRDSAQTGSSLTDVSEHFRAFPKELWRSFRDPSELREAAEGVFPDGKT